MDFQTRRALGETGAVTPAHLNILSPPTFCLTEMELRSRSDARSAHTAKSRREGSEGARERGLTQPASGSACLGADTKECFIPRKIHFKTDPDVKKKVLVFL